MRLGKNYFNFLRESAAILDQDKFPIIVNVGSTVRVEFYPEYIWALRDKLNFKELYLCHTHPEGFSEMSEEDRTTLLAWTMTFNPIPVNMVVLCVGDDVVTLRNYRYEMESYGSWLLRKELITKNEKISPRNKVLTEDKMRAYNTKDIFSDKVDWICKLLLLSYNIDYPRARAALYE